jgi:uncharacterized protein YcnI
VKNKASIYFDFNSAIVTNELFVTFLDTVIAHEDDGLVQIETCVTPIARIISLDTIVFEQDSIQLLAHYSSAAHTRWTSISAAGDIDSPMDSGTWIHDLPIGTNSFVWEVSSCGSTVLDTVQVTNCYVPSNAVIGNRDTVVYDVFDLDLSAMAPIHGIGQWEILDGASGEVTNRTSSQTSIRGLEYGLIRILWSVTNCDSAHYDTLLVEVCHSPSEAKISNANTLLFDTFELVLNAVTPEYGVGNWEILNGNTGGFADTSQSTTTVDGLGYGTTEIVWSVKNCDSVQYDTLTVQICHAPSLAQVSTPDGLYCGETTQNIEAVMPDHGEGLWQVVEGDGILDSDVLESTVVNSLSYGKNVLVWSVTSCDSTLVDTLVIEVQEPFEASFATEPDGYTLTAIEGDTYQWYFEGMLMEGETNRQLIARTIGDYQVEITKGVCTDISKLTNVPTGLDDDFFDNLSIYPNPTSGKLNIQFESGYFGQFGISVFDVTGKLVMEVSGHKDSERFSHQLDMDGLGNGLYILKLDVGGNTVQQKVILN